MLPGGQLARQLLPPGSEAVSPGLDGVLTGRQRQPGLPARCHLGDDLVAARFRYQDAPKAPRDGQSRRVLAELGHVPVDDQWDTWNMGIGLVVIVAAEDAEAARRAVPDAVLLGEVEDAREGERRVRLA